MAVPLFSYQFISAVSILTRFCTPLPPGTLAVTLGERIETHVYLDGL
jgi:hypothetical protein